MTLKSRVTALPPERYARGAQAAARLAAKAALRDGLPVPEEASRILNKTLAELADDVRMRDAEKEAVSAEDSTRKQAAPLTCLVDTASMIESLAEAREMYMHSRYDEVMEALEQAGALAPIEETHPASSGLEGAENFHPVPSPTASRVRKSVPGMNVYLVNPLAERDPASPISFIEFFERERPSK